MSAVFRTLHLLAFLFHTVLQGVDPQDLLVRQALSARQTFFQDLQALTRDLWCDSWDQWLDVMIQGLELVTPTNAGSHVKMRIAGSTAFPLTTLYPRFIVASSWFMRCEPKEGS